MVKDDLQNKGYNKEEEYFYKLNKKLIKDKPKDTKSQKENPKPDNQTAVKDKP